MAITHIPAEPGTGNLKAHPDLPILLELYGSASSTPWVEPQYQVFRENPNEKVVMEMNSSQEHVPGKGAAIGYLVQDGRAIAWGEVSHRVRDRRARKELKLLGSQKKDTRGIREELESSEEIFERWRGGEVQSSCSEKRCTIVLRNKFHTLGTSICPYTLFRRGENPRKAAYRRLSFSAYRFKMRLKF